MWVSENRAKRSQSKGPPQSLLARVRESHIFRSVALGKKLAYLRYPNQWRLTSPLQASIKTCHSFTIFFLFFQSLMHFKNVDGNSHCHITITFKGIPEYRFCGANALLSGSLKWRVFVNTNKCHCKLSVKAGC